MFIYRNKITGAELTSISEIHADNWELVMTDEPQEKSEKKTEAPKKTSRRGKK